MMIWYVTPSVGLEILEDLSARVQAIKCKLLLLSELGSGIFVVIIVVRKRVAPLAPAPGAWR
ncbi:hypothetical protein BJX63DRAFT_286272 [Aspergillus granulosus]|uniref:Uncharacterized protein n=1 Tax=Aspergillus granulosus TaxID=176169 RepID=A0ABR4H7B5_9EURO